MEAVTQCFLTVLMTISYCNLLSGSRDMRDDFSGQPVADENMILIGGFGCFSEIDLTFQGRLRSFGVYRFPFRTGSSICQ